MGAEYLAPPPGHHHWTIQPTASHYTMLTQLADTQHSKSSGIWSISIEIRTRDLNIQCHKLEISATNCNNNNFTMYKSIYYLRNILIISQPYDFRTVQVVPFICNWLQQQSQLQTVDLTRNNLSLAVGFKPDILSSLQIIQLYWKCWSYDFNIHMYLILCIWLVQ